MNKYTYTILQRRLLFDKFLIGIKLSIDKPFYGIRVMIYFDCFERCAKGSQMWQQYSKYSEQNKKLKE